MALRWLRSLGTSKPKNSSLEFRLSKFFAVITVSKKRNDMRKLCNLYAYLMLHSFVVCLSTNKVLLKVLSRAKRNNVWQVLNFVLFLKLFYSIFCSTLRPGLFSDQSLCPGYLTAWPQHINFFWSFQGLALHGSCNLAFFAAETLLLTSFVLYTDFLKLDRVWKMMYVSSLKSVIFLPVW